MNENVIETETVVEKKTLSPKTKIAIGAGVAVTCVVGAVVLRQKVLSALPIAAEVVIEEAPAV